MVERNLRRVYGPDYGGIALRRVGPADLRRPTPATGSSRSACPAPPSDELDAGMSFEGYGTGSRTPSTAASARSSPCPTSAGGSGAAFWLAATWKHKVTVVVEPLEPPELFEWFAALRRVLRHERRPARPRRRHRSGPGDQGGEHHLPALRPRHRRATGSRSSSSASARPCPPGPATLALRTGGAAAAHRRLLPTARATTRAIREAVPVERAGASCATTSPRITQDLADELEALIRADARAVAPAPAQLAERPRRLGGTGSPEAGAR